MINNNLIIDIAILFDVHVNNFFARISLRIRLL